MCYGYLVSLAQYLICQALNMGEDGYRYLPERLAVMALVNVALFVPMSLLMRYARRILGTPVESRVWWQLACLPALMIAALVLGGELFPLPYEWLYETLRISMSAVTVLLIWWSMRMVRTVSEDSRRQMLLMAALEREHACRADLLSDLAAARQRVEELEAAAHLGQDQDAPTQDEKDDGTPVDTSRRRIPELRQALEQLHN